MRRTRYWKGNSLMYSVSLEGGMKGDGATVAINKTHACFRVSPGARVSMFLWRLIISGKLRHSVVIPLNFVLQILMDIC